MKKFYFLVLLLFITVGANAQMTITQDGNTVTFTFDPSAGTLQNNSGGDLDLGSETPNLYSWIDTDDVEGGEPNYAVFGDWPGMPMENMGDGTWAASIDLGTLYGAGVIINEMNWIINGNGQQTSDMSGTEFGFTPVTIQVMAINNITVSTQQFMIVGTDIYFNQGGNFQVAVFNANGKLIKRFQVNANEGTMQSLNLHSKGMYFIQISDGNGQTQNLKVLK